MFHSFSSSFLRMASATQRPRVESMKGLLDWHKQLSSWREWKCSVMVEHECLVVIKGHLFLSEHKASDFSQCDRWISGSELDKRGHTHQWNALTPRRYLHWNGSQRSARSNLRKTSSLCFPSLSVCPLLSLMELSICVSLYPALLILHPVYSCLTHAHTHIHNKHANWWPG